MKIKLLLFLCLLMQLPNAVKATTLAEVVITGQVTDEKGEGLPGVSVVIKGTTTGTITDLDVVSLSATHTYVGDLVFTVRHVDTGKSVTIIDRGKVTRRKVMNGLSPRSRPASSSERSIFSRATKIGRIAKGA